MFNSLQIPGAMKKAIIIFAVIFSFFSTLGQQETDSTQFTINKYNHILGGLSLDTLRGKITVLYSRNYKVRAKAIDLLVENCVRFYEQTFPGTIFETEIVLIDSAAWERLSMEGPERMPPYGMPNNNSVINKIFIAADKKAVARLFGQTDNLPDSVLSMFDNVALHELGHIFLINLKHTYFEKRWANEFLASYFAICFLEEVHSRNGLPRVDLSNYHPRYRSLEDYERFYTQMDGPNFAWYHGKFTKLGNDLYSSYKTDLLKKFIASQSIKEMKTDPLILLRRLSPEITTKWLTEMK
jgi:hypothetical protein